MKSLLYSVLIILFTATNSYSTELKEAIDKSIASSIKIKAQSYALQGAKKQLGMNGIASFLPMVTYDFHIANVNEPEKDMIGRINPNHPSVDYTSKVGQLSINERIDGSWLAAPSQAKYQIAAEKLNFLQIKQKVLLDAVGAYVKVLTAMGVEDLSKHNKNVLRQHLDMAQKRFAVGEVTKTDVFQAEARLAFAMSEQIKADGNLKIANASYARIVGEEPENLLQPTDLPAIPDSLEECLETAKKSNPILKSVFYRHKAADQAVIIALSKSLPSLDILAKIKNVYKSSNQRDYSLSFNVSVPIFQRGMNFAAIDQANFTAKQYIHDYYEAIKNIEEEVITRWENVLTVRSILDSSQEAVKAAEVVVDGIKQEAELSLRTTIDVLDAERELFKAKINLTEAEGNYVISIYNLLFTIGNLNIT
ncbi:TolC family protein [Candidatus Mesenet endosymbiont of Agriotes lineatus]|uniref:TolC family protein n=1 Tax=Candidatus Mesenet endosymbiont of Agriotes lineatus TaxID=3077948 RepID=UPI0030CDFC53